MYTKKEEAMLKDVILAMDLLRNNYQVYGPGHSMIGKFLDRFSELLNKLLDLKEEVSLGITPDALMVEDKYFERDYKVFAELAKFFHLRAVSFITFIKGITVEEIKTFFENIIKTSDDIINTGGFGKILIDNKVMHIRVVELDYSTLIAKEAEEEATTSKDEEEFWNVFIDNLSKGMPAEITEDSIKVFEKALDESVQTAVSFNRVIKDDPNKTQEMGEIVKRLAICAKEKLFEQNVENKKRMEEVFSHLDPKLLSSLFKEGDKEENDRFKQALSGTLSNEAVCKIIEAVLTKDLKFSEDTLTILDSMCPSDERKLTVSNLLTKLLLDKGLLGWETAIGLIESIKELAKSNFHNKFITQLNDNINFCIENSVAEFKEDLQKVSEKPTKHTLSITRERVNLDFAQLVFEMLKTEENVKDLEFLTERFFDEVPVMISHGRFNFLDEFLTMFAKDYIQDGSEGADFKKGVFEKHIYKLSVPDIVNSLIKDIAKEGKEDFEVASQIMVLLGKNSIRLFLDAMFRQKNLPFVMNRVAGVMSKMGEGVVNEIGTWLEGKSEKAFADISPLLYKIGTDETLQYLRDIYMNNTEELKLEIMKAISEEPMPQGADILHMGFDSQNEQLRSMAIDGLVALRDKIFIDKLIKRLQSKNPFSSKSGAIIEAIELLKRVGSEEAIPYLGELLLQSVPFWVNADNIKITVVYTLSEIGTKEALECISKGTEDKGKAVRDICQYILNEKSQEAKQGGGVPEKNDKGGTERLEKDGKDDEGLEKNGK